MKRKIRKITRAELFLWSISTASLIIFLSGAGLFAMIEPQTSVGHAWFTTTYKMSPSRGFFLRHYSNNLAKYNGGYLPEQMDEFLCSRLEQTASESEFVAIAEFYADQGMMAELAGKFICCLLL